MPEGWSVSVLNFFWAGRAWSHWGLQAWSLCPSQPPFWGTQCTCTKQSAVKRNTENELTVLSGTSTSVKQTCCYSVHLLITGISTERKNKTKKKEEHNTLKHCLEIRPLILSSVSVSYKTGAIPKRSYFATQGVRHSCINTDALWSTWW